MTKPYVLIVDDNPDAQEILSVALGFLEYDVATANDGLEALESMQKRAPDLVLLDLMMPRMNGFQVLHHMQATPRLRHTPVIVVSAIENKMLLQLPGVSHVIQKAKYSLNELEGAITRLLGDDEQQKDPPKQPETSRQPSSNTIKSIKSITSPLKPIL